LRGNNKREIFSDEHDYADLGTRFATGLQRYGGRIHAWCWMTNHIHVLLQTADRPVGDLMRWVASSYAKSYNRAHDRTGHLFERRHKALLVHDDSYLLSLTRYIHLNPVEAGLVENPGDHRWSSYRAYLGVQNISWLTTSFVLRLFAESTCSARKSFQDFTVDNYDDQFDFEHESTADDELLDDEDCWCESLSHAEISVPRQTLTEFISEYCAVRNLNIVEVTGPSRQRHLSPIRASITEQALQSGIATLAEISREFNRSESVVLRTMNLWQAKHKSK
jgi:REP element-mobilizing transposase RayT